MTKTKNGLNKLIFGIFCAVIFAGFALVSANAQDAKSIDLDSTEQSDFFNSYDLTGTWEITVTPDDGSPSFIGFYSFNSDGIASFASAGPPIPGLGNPGFGVWKKTARNNRFAATIRMISYTTDFQFDGTLKINASIRMTTRDTFTTNDEVTVYAPDGSVIVVLGGSAQGRRLEVED